MPQTIVETGSYSRPRKCDVAVSNFVTFGKGDESPGSDSSMNGLFTNGESPKNGPWGLTSCARRETVDDKNEEGYENRHLNRLNNLYSDCDFSNSCQINNYKDIVIRRSNGLVDSSPNKSFNCKSMGIIKDTESEILGDFSDLLSSINASNYVSNGDSSDSKSYLDCFNVKHSPSSKPEDTESEILGDFSDLLSSITSPNKVSNGFHVGDSPDFNFYSSSSRIPKGSSKSEDSNSQNNETLADILSSISFEENNSTRKSLESSDFCRSSSCIPRGSLKSEYSNSQNNGTLSDILSSISLEENNSTRKSLESSDFCSSSSCIPKDSLKSEESNSQNNGTLSDILSSISLEENKSTPNGPKSSHSKLFFEDFEVSCMNRPEFSELNPNYQADNLKPKQSKLKSSILSPDSNLRHEDIKDPNVNRLNFNFKQTNSDPQNPTLSDILSSMSPLKSNPNNDILSASNYISKSNIKDAFMDTWLDFNNDNHRIPTSGINVPNPSSTSSMPNRKNEEFSFFSVSPENVFADMVSKLRKDVDSQDATDNDSTGITMLDLFKSVNSDSSSSLSEYLSTGSEGSLSDNKTETMHDLCGVMDIDLSSCVKTSDDVLNNISSEKFSIENSTDAFENDCNEVQLQSFMIKAFPETDCLKRPRMNLKQSLFAKSLSCKLRKNAVVLQKVAKIKSELFETYFNRPSPNIEATKSVVKNSAVNQSNNCMVTFHGRRICTDKGLEDVKCI